MVALLTILTAGLLLGRFARRITPGLELLLLLVVASVVLGQLVLWKTGMDISPKELIAVLVRGGQ